WFAICGVVGGGLRGPQSSPQRKNVGPGVVDNQKTAIVGVVEDQPVHADIDGENVDGRSQSHALGIESRRDRWGNITIVESVDHCSGCSDLTGEDGTGDHDRPGCSQVVSRSADDLLDVRPPIIELYLNRISAAVF